MQRLEVSCAVRLIHTSLGAKGLKAKEATQNSERKKREKERENE